MEQFSLIRKQHEIISIAVVVNNTWAAFNIRIRQSKRKKKLDTKISRLERRKHINRAHYSKNRQLKGEKYTTLLAPRLRTPYKFSLAEKVKRRYEEYPADRMKGRYKEYLADKRKRRYKESLANAAYQR